MATYTEVAKIAEDAANAQLLVVQQALRDKKLDEYAVGMAKLSASIQEWNKCLANVEYDRLSKEEYPVIAAVKQFYLTLFKVKEERDEENGTVKSVKIEPKNARIDLEKFCRFADISIEWAEDAMKLLDLLTLRETNVYALTPEALAKKSYYFVTAARSKKEGETPDSNRQIVILLQKIIDEAIFVDDGTGKNAYKCTSHDIAFIQDAVTKIDTKEKCTIAMLNGRQFKNVLMSVFAHCLGEAYKVRATQKQKKQNA